MITLPSHTLIYQARGNQAWSLDYLAHVWHYGYIRPATSEERYDHFSRGLAGDPLLAYYVQTVIVDDETGEVTELRGATLYDCGATLADLLPCMPDRVTFSNHPDHAAYVALVKQRRETTQALADAQASLERLRLSMSNAFDRKIARYCRYGHILPGKEEKVTAIRSAMQEDYRVSAAPIEDRIALLQAQLSDLKYPPATKE